MKEEKFPIIKAGYIFNRFNAKVNMPVILNKQEVEIESQQYNFHKKVIVSFYETI